ncbi:MAG: LysR family transcriptional regulator [Mycobacterium sp.]
MADPDLNLLIALDVLLAEGSVARASRRLGLSASAMSRTLTRLRDSTGDQLLVRAGRQMVLTPYAVALRERTAALVHEARTVLRPSEQGMDLATLDRTFTLRTNDGFVEVFGATLIAAVAEAAPLVRLRFAPKAEKSPAPLRDGQADLEIGVVAGMGPEVRTQALFRDRFVGIVAGNHPLASQQTVSAKQYVAHGHVVASRRGLTGGPVDEALASIGLKRRVAAVVPGFRAVATVTRGSGLIGLVPASYVPTLGDMHTFELPVKTPEITVSLMWHPRLDADPAHRWLRQRVLTACRSRTRE